MLFVRSGEDGSPCSEMVVDVFVVNDLAPVQSNSEGIRILRKADLLRVSIL
jgi:hypothetical protein